jgi:4-oxalocrotonate tautomerase
MPTAADRVGIKRRGISTALFFPSLIMPIITIHMLEGRSEAVKAQLISEVCETVVRVANVPPDAVRIIIEEMPKENYGIGGKTAKALGR